MVTEKKYKEFKNIYWKVETIFRSLSECKDQKHI